MNSEILTLIDLSVIPVLVIYGFILLIINFFIGWDKYFNGNLWLINLAAFFVGIVVFLILITIWFVFFFDFKFM